tara:strand:+ start:1228 stop:1788 length:561 start_codon:yes stop_codon:yes gene_type:complete
MNLKNILIGCLLLFFNSTAQAADTIYLYKGSFSRSIKIKELNNFKRTKIADSKLKNLIKITNQNEEELYKILSYEVDMPITASSKLLNSKIGEVFLSRLTQIIHPYRISNKEVNTKAIRSGIILSSYKNNQKINLIEFFKAYPNQNIAINLNALNKTLRKVESLKDLVEFYSNSPFKKLKEGRSSI